VILLLAPILNVYVFQELFLSGLLIPLCICETIYMDFFAIKGVELCVLRYIQLLLVEVLRYSIFGSLFI
jgi:hypothetical protein